MYGTFRREQALEIMTASTRDIQAEEAMDNIIYGRAYLHHGLTGDIAGQSRRFDGRVKV